MGHSGSLPRLITTRFRRLICHNNESATVLVDTLRFFLWADHAAGKRPGFQTGQNLLRRK
jgi:hypothetical protein